MDLTDYPHASTGTLAFDPSQGTRHYNPWWALMLCDDGIVDYYSWLLGRRGVAVHKGSHWGAHVCFVRGEEPPDKAAWGLDPGPVEFRYSNVVRWDNGYHAWLDVWCPTLTEVRARLGLRTRPRTYYHLTIGRLALPREARADGRELEDTLLL